ncbi:MAG: methionine gamma-lyase family protein [Clostridia bacterium]|nr:methionine gamma-lyase family protein [Clostridia bacterium]
MNVYQKLGISPRVIAYAEEILKDLKPRFEEIDRIAEFNQAKVIYGMQESRVSAACFVPTTGYGHDDVGRDTLEKVYSVVFGTEAALVRPQITCGFAAVEEILVYFSLWLCYNNSRNAAG